MMQFDDEMTEQVVRARRLLDSIPVVIWWELAYTVQLDQLVLRLPIDKATYPTLCDW